MESDILTLEELARYLQIHRTTCYRLIRARKLPGFKVGRDWRVNEKSLERWMRERTIDPRGGEAAHPLRQ